MKNIPLAAVLAFAALACQATPKQDTPSQPHASASTSPSQSQMPQPAAPTEQHKWLDQLVGEWNVSSEMSMGPDIEPMKMEFTESVRSIGGLWVLAESKAAFFGQPYSSLMTLGYDEKKKAFIGTWVDTMQPHMWHYLGSLDEAKKTLTLEAEGPSFEDPTKMAKYRDALTLEGRDHKVLRSSVLGADGKWTQFMEAHYTRKK